jgi:uncharacterized protein (TIGR02444 family)
MTDSPADATLWDFACAVYAAAGVSSACLALQQAVGADVNLLLFAAWIGASRGVVLAPEQGRRAVSCVAAWHDEIVRPLRAVRVRLKSVPSPAPSAAESLRAQVKVMELASERIELNLLEANASAWLQAPASEITNTPGTDPAGANLRTILPAAAGDPVLAIHLDAIARAAVHWLSSVRHAPKREDTPRLA